MFGNAELFGCARGSIFSPSSQRTGLHGTDISDVSFVSKCKLIVDILINSGDLEKNIINVDHVFDDFSSRFSVSLRWKSENPTDMLIFVSSEPRILSLTIGKREEKSNRRVEQRQEESLKEIGNRLSITLGHDVEIAIECPLISTVVARAYPYGRGATFLPARCGAAPMRGLISLFPRRFSFPNEKSDRK